MLSRLGSLLGSAVSAIGRGIDSALGAVAGAVLGAATALAPKAPPSSPPYFGGTPRLGVCPGGRDWRGPFPTAVDAHEYRLDIPVPTSIHQFADGWWVYIEYGMPAEVDDGELD